MKTIWKYKLALSTLKEELAVPQGAKPLCIKEQRGMPTLWLLVDTEAPLTGRLQCVGTGNPTPKELGEYIDTVMYLLNDNLVFHFYIK